MKRTMNKLFELTVGSRLYGINRDDSDFDKMFCFVSTDPAKILGLVTQEKQELPDYNGMGYELRHFIKLVEKGSPNLTEVLFAGIKDFDSLQFDIWEKMFLNREKFVNIKSLYHALKGYSYNEARLVIGQRHGQLGSQRQQALKEYGYSPKNAANLIRILYGWGKYFLTGQYDCNFYRFASEKLGLVMDIRNHPGSYKLSQIERLMEEETKAFHEAWEKRVITNHYDQDYVVDFLRATYLPFLT